MTKTWNGVEKNSPWLSNDGDDGQLYLVRIRVR